MPDDQPIALADAVRALRSELDRAVAEAEGAEIKFELGTIEMEFLVEVAKERGGEAGIKFWVVNLGAKDSATSTVTHRVTLELKAKDAHGRSPRIAATESRRGR